MDPFGSKDGKSRALQLVEVRPLQALGCHLDIGTASGGAKSVLRWPCRPCAADRAWPDRFPRGGDLLSEHTWNYYEPKARIKS